jgi:transcriptional regulator with XRE-family HTH domain
MPRALKSPEKAQLLARLKAARKEAGLTQLEVAKLLEIDRDTYAKYETRTVIPTEVAQRAAPILGVHFTYLVALEGNGDRTPTHRHDSSNALSTRPVIVRGEIQAGVFREAIELPPEEQTRLMVPLGIPYSDKPLEGLRVIGPSMNKWYPEGSYVIVLPTIHLSSGWVPAPGQHVVVQRENEWGEIEATIKEVAYDGQDLLLWPRSEDPGFQKPWRISAPKTQDPDNQSERIRITGLVVWSMRAAPGV